MKALKFLAPALALAMPISVAPAMAAEPAPAAAPAYSVETTEIGTLLDAPAAKAVLDKHLPEFTANPQIDMARGMTLKQVQPYAPDMTDDVLAAIAADLAKLPKPAK